MREGRGALGGISEWKMLQSDREGKGADEDLRLKSQKLNIYTLAGGGMGGG